MTAWVKREPTKVAHLTGIYCLSAPFEWTAKNQVVRLSVEQPPDLPPPGEGIGEVGPGGP